MALNLSRNTKVYFTTNLDAQNKLNSTAASYTANNTWEIQVLDGYKFTQNTNQQTVQPREAGAIPSRGQRSFNTELAPVDWNFSTYIRPFKDGTNVNMITSIEKYLWNALAGRGPVQTSTLTAVNANALTRAVTTTGVCTAVGAAGFGDRFSTTPGATNNIINITGAVNGAGYDIWSGAFKVTSTTTSNVVFTNPYLRTEDGTTATASPSTITAGPGQWFEANNTSYGFCSFAGSNVHTLQPFGLLFVVDSAIYGIDNCALDKADIDFGIDAISQVAWSGKGTLVRDLTGTANLSNTLSAITLSAAASNANFITNKLSTLSLIKNIEGLAPNNTAYSIAITGGTLSINNNIQYLTPQILGKVNTPIGYFVGARSITGNLTAYLKTGTLESAKLLSDVLAGASTSVENYYYVKLAVGGDVNTLKVEFDMPACMLQVPTVDVQDVVSTTINFTAQPYQQAGSTDQNSLYNLDQANELKIRYYSPN